MLGRTIRALYDRRVLHMMGLYLAAGWGLLEFTSWAVDHFAFPPRVEDVFLAVWLLLAPAVALATWRWGPGAAGSWRVPTGDAVPSLAVLPFTNLSVNPEDSFLSEGITEEVTSALARLEGLQVASRTSTLMYRSAPEDVRALGRKLNVRTVLEGSLQRSGDRLRITTQLINVADGYHLWAGRYDSEIQDVFQIEDEIAANVARVLKLMLRQGRGGELGRVPTPDVRAYEYYLRGRQFFRQTRRKSLQFAWEMFQRAIEIDPQYARAHAALADTAAVTRTFYPTAEVDLEEAERAALRALELDPDLAEAHGAHGSVLFLFQRYEEAEREFKAAIQLDPRLFDPRYFYARMCFQQGRLAEAAELFEAANAVQEDYSAAFFAGQAYEALGRPAAAGDAYARALRIVEEYMDINPDDARAATMRAVSLCRVGRRQEGLVWASRALAIDPEDAGVRYNVACLYAVAGEIERAMQCLEDAVRGGFGNREWVARDPDLAALRDHPRFRALMEPPPAADPGTPS